MAEQIEITEAVEAAARQLFALNYQALGEGTIEHGIERWDTTGGVDGYTKFTYREKVHPMIAAGFDSIAKQVWAAAQEHATTEAGSPVLGDYPGFEVTRG